MHVLLTTFYFLDSQAFLCLCILNIIISCSYYEIKGIFTILTQKEAIEQIEANTALMIYNYNNKITCQNLDQYNSVLNSVSDIIFDFIKASLFLTV